MIARMAPGKQVEALRQLHLIIRYHGASPYGRQAAKLLRKLRTEHGIDLDAESNVASL